MRLVSLFDGEGNEIPIEEVVHHDDGTITVIPAAARVTSVRVIRKDGQREDVPVPNGDPALIESWGDAEPTGYYPT